MLQEKRWIEGLRSGSEIIFREIYMNYKDQVYNTCLRFIPNQADAEDLLQEVFVEVFKSGQKFKGQAKLSTWIYRIAVNKSLELLRKRKRLKRRFYFHQTQSMEECLLDIRDRFNHPGVLLENKERAQILYAAIDMLPESQQTAFHLQKTEGLSQAEIATLMETTESSVESLLYRAKRNLRKYLKDWYEKEEKNQ